MAFNLATVASSGADFPDWAGAEAAIIPNGTGGDTMRGILDESLTGFMTVNAPNSNGQDIIAEGGAGVRFSALNRNNGVRLFASATGLLGIATNNVILQDLSLRATHATGAVVHLLGTTADADTFIMRRCMLYGNGNCFFGKSGGSPTIAFNLLVFESAVTQGGLFYGGKSVYNTLLAVDGTTTVNGVTTTAADSLVTGNVVIGTVTNEYSTTWAAASTDNLGDVDATPPPNTFYDLSADGRDKNDIIAVTDGVDNSRDKANAAWNAYTAPDVTDGSTGTKDVLGNEVDVADLRVGAEQVIGGGGGGGETLNDLEAGTLEVWALVSSMNNGDA